MAWADITYSDTAVILDHSSFISYTTSATGGLIITFSSSASYSQAKSSWVSASSLLLVANKPGFCGQGQGESCYFKVDTLEFSDSTRSCSVSGKYRGINDVLVRADVEWGAYVPGARPPRFTPGSGASQSYEGGSHTSSTTSPISPFSTSSSSRFGPYSSSSGVAPGGYSTNTGNGSPYGTSTTSSVNPAGPSTTGGSPNGGSSTTSGSPNGGSSTTSSVSAGASTTSTTTTSAFPASNATGVITGDTSANKTNCTAPTDGKYGLRTACLGPYFDQDLDDTYGYEGIGDTPYASFLAGFANLEYPDATTDPNDPDFVTDDALDKRGLVSWLAKKVATGLNAVGIPTKYSKTIERQYPISIPGNRKLVDSPWGQQVLIKSFKKESDTTNAKLDIYCVDCGAKGQANIAGKVSVSLEQGIEALNANFQGDLTVAVKVGVDANFKYEQTFSQQLFQVGIPGTCIGGIVCVGPSVKMGADVKLTADANGQLLAGAAITIHDARASVDMLASQKGTASGWQPEFIPTLEAKGSIALKADVGIPVAIVVGVDILSGKFKKEIALIDRPSIIAEAAVSASISTGTDGTVTGSVGTTDGCKGIATKISLKNKMWAEIPGLNPFVLADMDPKKLAEKCIPLGDQSTGGGTNPTNPDPTNPDPTNPDPTNPDPTNPDQNEPGDSTGGGDPTDGGVGKRSKFGQLNARQTTNSSSSGVVDTTAASNANASTSTADYILPDPEDKSYNTTDGYTVASLIDPDEKYQILPCSDGNVYIFGINDTVPQFECADMWTMSPNPNESDEGTEDDRVVADAMGRIPHFYPEEMSKTGVSRFRVSDVENIPIDVENVYFINLDADGDAGNSDLYFAVDIEGTGYYPIICTYQESTLNARVFLAADPDAGVELLKSPDIKYSITGGTVKDCFFMPLVLGT